MNIEPIGQKTYGWDASFRAWQSNLNDATGWKGGVERGESIQEAKSA